MHATRQPANPCPCWLVVFVVAAGGRSVGWLVDCDDREPEFGGSAEGRLAFELLTAFEHNDQQALQQLTQRQTLTFLDNQLARLAKSLRLPAAACAPGSDSGSLA
eukprot:TRINITY_DN4712_c0_g1_i3.p5 TRINITY_DN4712_c0_g1~~TRINITY_DN4712_c0_g1_i3.p5  ORF type:complete len:105 (+),score=35.33 TRINITY_DN4712_c0_g1_i3:96-410(+)